MSIVFVVDFWSVWTRNVYSYLRGILKKKFVSNIQFSSMSLQCMPFWARLTPYIARKVLGRIWRAIFLIVKKTNSNVIIRIIAFGAMWNVCLLDLRGRIILGTFGMDAYPRSCWRFLQLETGRLIVPSPFAMITKSMCVTMRGRLLCCWVGIPYRIAGHYSIIYFIEFFTAFFIAIDHIDSSDNKTIACYCVENIPCLAVRDRMRFNDTKCGIFHRSGQVQLWFFGKEELHRLYEWNEDEFDEMKIWIDCEFSYARI